MKTHNLNSVLPPENSVISSGMHKEELTESLHGAPYDHVFTPLLIEDGVLSREFDTSQIIPAVTYGMKVVRPTKFDAVELVPGANALLQDSLGSPYFNPHLSIRTRAHNLIDTLVGESGKGSKRVRGESFGLPSYVFENHSGRHLFVGGKDTDKEGSVIDERLAKTLAVAYDLGSVTVGNQVVIGDVKVNAGKTSVPTLMGEIGKTVSKLEVSAHRKAQILSEALSAINRGESPDYRPYMKFRKGWPKK